MPLEVKITTKEKVLVTAVPVDDSEQEVLDAEPVSFTIQSGTGTLEPVSNTTVFVRSGEVAEDVVVAVAGRTGTPTDTVTVHVSLPVVVGATHFMLASASPVPK